MNTAWILFCTFSSAIMTIAFLWMYLLFTKFGNRILVKWFNAILSSERFKLIAYEKMNLALSGDEADALVDEKLETLVLVFKKKIPMAATFLKGELLQKLKISAREELIKIFPEAKEKMVEKMMQADFSFDALDLLQNERKISFNLIKIILVCGVIGLVWGLILTGFVSVYMS